MTIYPFKISIFSIDKKTFSIGFKFAETKSASGNFNNFSILIPKG